MIPEGYCRVGLTTITAITTFCAFIYTGQTVEVQADLIDQAMDNLYWYNFNKSNKLLFIITKSDTARGRRIKFSSKWSINYDLGWAVSYVLVF